MKARLICYTIKNVENKKRNKFSRELLGYTDRSNKNQYKYKREGILSRIPHCRPVRSVIIVENKNYRKIIKFLNKYKAKIIVYEVNIDKNKLKIPQGASR